jgi:hypothetical protein
MACRQLKEPKYIFGVPEIPFVGYRILRDGIDTEEKMVEAIMS